MEKYSVAADCLIELHLHLDGSISVASARELGKLAGVALPEKDEDLEALLRVSEGCKDLNEYLEKFALPLSLLQSEETVEQAVCTLCRELKAEGHIYAEIRFAPQLCCQMGLTQEQVVQAALRGLKKSGFRAQLILCCMRSGEDNRGENLETVELTAKYLGQGVCACDLAGAEALFPNPQYAYAFDRARELGVPFTIHSGEALGAESVRQALDYGARRIGHGVRAIEDPAVMAVLKEKGIALEVCPTSNLQTCVFPDYAQEPVDTFLKYGIPVTISSDNRTVSGTDARKELQTVAQTFGYTQEQVKGLLYNAVEAAFADEKTKAELRAEIDRI